MRVAFELSGEMPLLMHADDVEAADALKAWRQSPENKNFSLPGDDRSPAWTWQTCLYSDGEAIAMPSGNIMVAIRQAGAQLILKKQKTFKEISQSGLLIDTEFCQFLNDGKEVPIADYDWRASSAGERETFEQQVKSAAKCGIRLFTKRAKIGQSKHIRVRPRFESWAVRGTVNVLVPEITFEILERLFTLSGRIGLCDWRPGCKTPGPYGMFTAKLSKAN